MDFIFDGSEIPNVGPVSVVKDVVAGTAGTTLVGDLFRYDDGNAGYFKKCANGDTDVLTLNRVYLCTKQSTETAIADGVVEGIWCPSMRLKGTPSDASALVQAVIETRVTLDISGTTQLIDEGDSTNGFMRIMRPEGGADNFDTTNGYNTLVVVNEHFN